MREEVMREDHRLSEKRIGKGSDCTCSVRRLLLQLRDVEVNHSIVQPCERFQRLHIPSSHSPRAHLTQLLHTFRETDHSNSYHKSKCCRTHYVECCECHQFNLNTCGSDGKICTSVRSITNKRSKCNSKE